MQVIILGKEDSKVSDFFSIITQGKASVQNKKTFGTALVSDPRVDELSAFFKPKKTTYTQLSFFSVEMASPTCFEDVKTADLIVYMIRAFSAYEGDQPQPQQELESFITTLKLKDMEILERFIERNKKDLSKTKEVESASQLLAEIENLGQVKQETLAKCEFLKHTALLSTLPLFFVFNRDENEIKDEHFLSVLKNKFPDYPMFSVSTSIEKELLDIDKTAYVEFLQAYQIDKPALEVLINEIYQDLGLITFFTVGEDEVRAWTVKKGSNAFESAGKIHTDIQKGFIRAEIVHYADFVAHHFSFKEAKEKGVFYLEGKEYIVQDGDIMHVRFNI